MNTSQLRVSILAIGTELTTGQILNRNGSWLSSQIQKLGAPTSLHLVVPDERLLMLEALQFCSNHSDIIIVTGGLGPTTDDLTRDVIAEWTQRTLVWDEASMKHIQDRLGPRGIAVRDIQKQQCYFPEGSEILLNRNGTANAFSLEHHSKWILSLPGPPREIEGIWNDFIFEKMRERTKNIDAMITRSWDTIGFGESDIADLTEKALLGCDCEKGYRVHLPFVEFKISYLKSQSEQAQKWTQNIEAVLNPMTVLRDGEDAAQKLSVILEKFESVWIEDSNHGSFILQRLVPFYKNLLSANKLQFTQKNAFEKNPNTLHLQLFEESPGCARAIMTWRGQSRLQQFSSPYKSTLMKERENQYFAEMALLFWLREIESYGL